MYQFKVHCVVSNIEHFFPSSDEEHSLTMGGCASTETDQQDASPLMTLTQQDKQELLMSLTVHKDLDRIKSIIDRYPGIDVNTIRLDDVSAWLPHGTVDTWKITTMKEMMQCSWDGILFIWLVSMVA